MGKAAKTGFGMKKSPNLLHKNQKNPKNSLISMGGYTLDRNRFRPKGKSKLYRHFPWQLNIFRGRYIAQLKTERIQSTPLVPPPADL